MNEAIAIVHADDALVAVNKPPGIAAHRSRLVGEDDDYLVDRVRAQTGRTLYLVHRLDRATSGLNLFAGSRELAASLGEQFMSRAVDKTYLAVCRGWPEASGAIDYALDAPGQREAKAALTEWRRLATATVPIALGRYPEQRYALLAVYPRTGRYQQIRRHFHHVSHHLIGDTTHGRGDHNRLFRQYFGAHRLLLHAWRLSFRHPSSDAPLTLEAPIDASFTRVFEALGWREALTGV